MSLPNEFLPQVPFTTDSPQVLFLKMAAALSAMLSADAGDAGSPVVPGFSIPAHDYIGMTYVGSTNNVSTVTYKTGGASGTTLLTLTFAYVASGAADDDDISSITKS